MTLEGQRAFVGFGLGPIQSGLFLAEAWRSGEFGRLAVLEVARDIVEGVRANGGRITVNTAHAKGIRAEEIAPVETFDPEDPGDREALVDLLAGASEAATAVPSTTFYATERPGSIHRLLARAIERREGPPLVVYAGENHRRAAEILRDAVRGEASRATRDVLDRRAVFLNTVIGKMSGVISGRSEMDERGIRPLVPGVERAHLVEEFRRILIETPRLPSGEVVRRGIRAFLEKDDLGPFEEAKLHGHNAAHALAAYLGALRGAKRMADLGEVPGLVDFVRAASTDECGAALRRRHAGKDPLFEPRAFEAHIDDLIRRMLNPHLGDLVERVARDPARKLGWNDRLVGTARLVLGEGIEPRRLALGIAAALRTVSGDPETSRADRRGVLREIWRPDRPEAAEMRAVLALVEDALPRLERYVAGARPS